MRLPLVLIGFSTAFALSAGANAMNSITNLDDQPHQVSIISIGGAERVVEIPAGQTVRFNEYQSQLKIAGNDQAAQPSRMGDQFTIWQDGALRLQRRQYQRFDQY